MAKKTKSKIKPSKRWRRRSANKVATFGLRKAMKCGKCGKLRSDAHRRKACQCGEFSGRLVEAVYYGDDDVQGERQVVLEKLRDNWGPARVRIESHAGAPDLSADHFTEVVRCYMGPKFDHLDRAYKRSQSLEVRRRKLAAAKS